MTACARPLVDLFIAICPSDHFHFPDQKAEGHLQGGSNAGHIDQSDIPLAAFHIADISAVDISKFSELFLRETFG